MMNICTVCSIEHFYIHISYIHLYPSIDIYSIDIIIHIYSISKYIHINLRTVGCSDNADSDRLGGCEIIGLTGGGINDWARRRFDG